jgi:nucleoside-diphosphate-sugar epimerase
VIVGDKVVVTGASGFLGGYIVKELLSRGYEVVGIDNYSKYGDARIGFESSSYRAVQGDASDVSLMRNALDGALYLIANAAMVGGIGYFHSYPYDLLAENNNIMAATCRSAIDAHNNGELRRVVYVSSSMVYESTTSWPSSEGDELAVPPPRTSYGMQKLVSEYYARSAWEQYRLPYVIVRPFNCVGVGEFPDVRMVANAGTDALAMSHVLPDLIRRILGGEFPVRILGAGNQIRHFTFGGDIAAGIVRSMEAPEAANEAFNISSPVGHSILDVAEKIFARINPGAEFKYLSVSPYEDDVLRRVPSVHKARDVLGVTCDTSLDAVLDELIPWVAKVEGMDFATG